MCVQLYMIININRVKRRWHGLDYANQGRSWGDVDTLDYNVIEAYPLLCSTSDMTKVQILRWALSRFRMEGYPYYCLIEISVSSKKQPRALNSFQGKDSPGPLFFFSLVGVSISDQCGKLNAYYRFIFLWKEIWIFGLFFYEKCIRYFPVLACKSFLSLPNHVPLL